MENQDMISLDQILKKYSCEEFSNMVTALCKSKNDTDALHIIFYMQKATGTGTVRICSTCGSNMFDNGNNFRCGKCGKRVHL